MTARLLKKPRAITLETDPKKGNKSTAHFTATQHTVSRADRKFGRVQISERSCSVRRFSDSIDPLPCHGGVLVNGCRCLAFGDFPCARFSRTIFTTVHVYVRARLQWEVDGGGNVLQHTVPLFIVAIGRALIILQAEGSHSHNYNG